MKPLSAVAGISLVYDLTIGIGMLAATGTFAGRFDPVRLMKALDDFGITNMSAAATHYRMMRLSGAADRYAYTLRTLSFTGEPIDSATATGFVGGNIFCGIRAVISRIVHTCVPGDNMNLVVIVHVHNTFYFTDEVIGLFIADTTGHINTNTNVHSIFVHHAW